MKLGDWYIYCDICGQRSYASQSTKLSTYTGHGGAIVCKHDVDKIDYGLIPYTPRKENIVPYVRINHTDTSDGSPFVDLEEMTLIYYLSSSQDNIILTTSQDDSWITVNQPF